MTYIPCISNSYHRDNSTLKLASLFLIQDTFFLIKRSCDKIIQQNLFSKEIGTIIHGGVTHRFYSGA